jgi:TonB family protein
MRRGFSSSFLSRENSAGSGVHRWRLSRSLVVPIVGYLLFGPTQAAHSLQAPVAGGPAEQQAVPVGIESYATPDDPKDRLEAGWRSNGLERPGSQPWHLKAIYEVFDADGKPSDKGTFEEWWVNQTQYRLSYSGTKFSQEEYGTDHGFFHAGDPNWPDGPLRLLQPTVIRPIPSPEEINDWGKHNVERKFGDLKLSCTALSYHGGKEVSENSPAFCFDRSKIVLRYSNTSFRATQTIFDHPTVFRDGFVAREIRILVLGKASLSIHIAELENMKPEDREKLVVPANASTVVRRVVLSSLESGSHTLKKVPPEYPVEAKAVGAQGAVVIAATISRDGHVTDVQVLGGPVALQGAAADAVRKWVFKPLLIDGEPVEVETDVNVIFTLGQR